MVKSLCKPARKLLLRNRREIKVGYFNLLCGHENYSRDYLGRVAIAAIFRWLLAGKKEGSCFQTVGRLTHARDHKLQVALAAGCRPSDPDLAAFHRALAGGLPAWAEGNGKDFSPFSSDTPCVPGSQGEALNNPRGFWKREINISGKTRPQSLLC